MKHLHVGDIAAIIIASSFLLSGCSLFASDTESSAVEELDLVSVIDYTDWYRDIKNTNTYNYTTWFELDVWLKVNADDYGWTDVTYDVLYEGTVIASDLAASVEYYYYKCYFDASYEGALLTDNGYLVPGNYEIVLKDKDKTAIASSNCIVSTDSGDVLSQMIVNIEQLDNQENQMAVRIDFDGDIRPYAATGFGITISLDGDDTSFVPEKRAIEVAETYIIVRYYEPDTSAQTALVNLYCGDGSFVCSAELEV